MADYDAITQALVQCDADKVNQLVQSMLDEGNSAGDILNQGLVAGMDIIGDKMENGDMFIPEVLMAAQIMSGAVETLKPLLAEGDVKVKGKVVIGTVKGDLHDIGKNLVAMMLASSGLEVINLGVDISPEQFVAEIKSQEAQVLCLSALLTTTMPMMKATIDALADSGLRQQVKVMVGGAPVTQNFADEIGADGFATDAGSAAKMAKALVN
jgi:5-methyltetrahydrofolate--homocysteine methyltransferase